MAEEVKFEKALERLEKIVETSDKTSSHILIRYRMSALCYAIFNTRDSQLRVRNPQKEDVKRVALIS